MLHTVQAMQGQKVWHTDVGGSHLQAFQAPAFAAGLQTATSTPRCPPAEKACTTQAKTNTQAAQVTPPAPKLGAQEVAATQSDAHQDPAEETCLMAPLAVPNLDFVTPAVRDPATVPAAAAAAAGSDAAGGGSAAPEVARVTVLPVVPVTSTAEYTPFEPANGLGSVLPQSSMLAPLGYDSSCLGQDHSSMQHTTFSSSINTGKGDVLTSLAASGHTLVFSAAQQPGSLLPMCLQHQDTGGEGAVGAGPGLVHSDTWPGLAACQATPTPATSLTARANSIPAAAAHVKVPEKCTVETLGGPQELEQGVRSGSVHACGNKDGACYERSLTGGSDTSRHTQAPLTPQPTLPRPFGDDVLRSSLCAADASQQHATVTDPTPSPTPCIGDATAVSGDERFTQEEPMHDLLLGPGAVAHKPHADSLQALDEDTAGSMRLPSPVACAGVPVLGPLPSVPHGSGSGSALSLLAGLRGVAARKPASAGQAFCIGRLSCAPKRLGSPGLHSGACASHSGTPQLWGSRLGMGMGSTFQSRRSHAGSSRRLNETEGQAVAGAAGGQVLEVEVRPILHPDASQ